MKMKKEARSSAIQEINSRQGSNTLTCMRCKQKKKKTKAVASGIKRKLKSDKSLMASTKS